MGFQRECPQAGTSPGRDVPDSKGNVPREGCPWDSRGSVPKEECPQAGMSLESQGECPQAGMSLESQGECPQGVMSLEFQRECSRQGCPLGWQQAWRTPPAFPTSSLQNSQSFPIPGPFPFPPSFPLPTLLPVPPHPGRKTLGWFAQQPLCIRNFPPFQAPNSQKTSPNLCWDHRGSHQELTCASGGTSVPLVPLVPLGAAVTWEEKDLELLEFPIPAPEGWEIPKKSSSILHPVAEGRRRPGIPDCRSHKKQQNPGFRDEIPDLGVEIPHLGLKTPHLVLRDGGVDSQIPEKAPASYPSSYPHIHTYPRIQKGDARGLGAAG